ncbi:hypothetical protein MXB_5083 [Myxobolus squamalis]|nr:hypothetical protein MXB_5083 [Myxobolus squamalis]
MADIIFHVKTSRSTQFSRNYVLSLNNNFKNIIIQYLESKKLKSDGGYDVYMKRNKKYVKDLDVSMLTLKDELDLNGQLEVEIVYYGHAQFPYFRYFYI